MVQSKPCAGFFQAFNFVHIWNWYVYYYFLLLQGWAGKVTTYEGETERYALARWLEHKPWNVGWNINKAGGKEVRKVLCGNIVWGNILHANEWVSLLLPWQEDHEAVRISRTKEQIIFKSKFLTWVPPSPLSQGGGNFWNLLRTKLCSHSRSRIRIRSSRKESGSVEGE